MPHRKPPKRLSTSCTAVISNTVLDVIVKVEQTIIKDSSNIITEATNEQSGCCSGVKYSSDRLQKYDDMELEIAKYILSNIPNALISLVILEIIKEFASRWYKIIQLSEQRANVQRNDDLTFR